MNFLFGSSAPAAEIPLLTVSTKPISSQVINAEKTMENIPEHVLQQLDVKIAELKARLTSNPVEWEPFMKDKGVIGIRRFGEGGAVAIRSETVLPFHIVDIFEFINNTKNMPVLDPNVNSSTVLKRFSTHSWVNYLTVNGLWPVVSPRDVVSFFHWQLLEDGSVLYLCFSTPFDDLKPVSPTGDVIRAWDNLYGFLFRPTEDGRGTDVHMLFDNDPRGDIPTALVNQAQLNQPTSLTVIRDKLTELRDAGKARDVSMPARYEDFVAAVNKNAAL